MEQTMARLTSMAQQMATLKAHLTRMVERMEGSLDLDGIEEGIAEGSRHLEGIEDDT